MNKKPLLLYSLIIFTFILAAIKFGGAAFTSKRMLTKSTLSDNIYPKNSSSKEFKNEKAQNSSKTKRMDKSKISSSNYSQKRSKQKSKLYNKPFLRQTKETLSDMLQLQSEIENSVKNWNMPKIELLLRALASKGHDAFPVFLDLLERYPYLPRLYYFINQIQQSDDFNDLQTLYKSNKDNRIRSTIINLLRTNENSQATNFLITLLRQKLPLYMTKRVISSLSYKNSPDAINTLLNMIDDHINDSIGRNIVLALAQHEDANVREKYFSIIVNNSNFGLTYSSITALRKIGDKKSGEKLIKLIPYLKNRTLRQAAFTAVGEMIHNQGKAVLMNYVDNFSAEKNKIGSPEDIFYMNDMQVYQNVKKLLLTGKIKEMRSISPVIEYFGQTGFDDASKMLQSLYSDNYRAIDRFHIVQAISEIPTEDNLNFLSKIINGNTASRYLRLAALESMKKGFGEEAIPVFQEALQKGGNLALASYDSLSELGSSQALEILDHYQKKIKIEQIMNNSQASEIGLKPGDIIVSYNHVSVSNAKDLQREVIETSINQPAELEIERDGQLQLFVLDGGYIGIYMNESVEPVD